MRISNVASWFNSPDLVSSANYMQLKTFLLFILLLTSFSGTSAVYENRRAENPGTDAAPLVQILPQCEQYARVSETNAFNYYLADWRLAHPPFTNLSTTASPNVDQFAQGQAQTAVRQAYGTTLNSCLRSSGYQLVRQCVRNCTI